MYICVYMGKIHRVFQDDKLGMSLDVKIILIFYLKLFVSKDSSWNSSQNCARR
jgi:hypothetical protein